MIFPHRLRPVGAQAVRGGGEPQLASGGSSQSLATDRLTLLHPSGIRTKNLHLKVGATGGYSLLPAWQAEQFQ